MSDEIISWMNEPGRVQMLFEELTAMDLLTPWSNKDADTLLELSEQWSEDLRGFRFSEIKLGLQRWRTEGKAQFPMPSDILRTIEANRRSGRCPRSDQAAIEHKSPTINFTAGGSPLGEEIKRLVNERGMLGLDALKQALVNKGYRKNQQTGKWEQGGAA